MHEFDCKLGFTQLLVLVEYPLYTLITSGCDRQEVVSDAQVIWVTGASRGLGAALAVEAARWGGRGDIYI